MFKIFRRDKLNVRGGDSQVTTAKTVKKAERKIKKIVKRSKGRDFQTENRNNFYIKY